jgi:hypothetical protein
MMSSHRRVSLFVSLYVGKWGIREPLEAATVSHSADTWAKRLQIIPVFQARRAVCIRAKTPPRVAAWQGAISVECGTVSLRYMG